ncbi:MAG: hypothetical protein ACI9G1_003601 [Pirellulaceae bacterium]
MSSFSDFLGNEHPLDGLGEVAAAESQELARLFGNKAAAIGGTVGTSSLPAQLAKRFWASHRERLEQLVLHTNAKQPARSSICILGAGRCLDIDLEKLARHGFVDITLMDLDRSGMYSALEEFADTRSETPTISEGQGRSLKLSFAGDRPFSLTACMIDGSLLLEGMANCKSHFLPQIESLVADRKEPREVFQAVTNWISKSATHPAELPNSGWDVVFSDCLLSQMTATVTTKILVALENVVTRCLAPESIEPFVLMVSNIAEQQVLKYHLRLLAKLSNTSGPIHIASDAVAIERRKIKSSRTYPTGYQLALDDGETAIIERRIPRFTGQRHLRDSLIPHLSEWPGATAVNEGQWLWNRQPCELIEAAEDFTSSQPIYAEEVQAVTVFGMSEKKKRESGS